MDDVDWYMIVLILTVLVMAVSLSLSSSRRLLMQGKSGLTRPNGLRSRRQLTA